MNKPIKRAELLVLLAINMAAEGTLFLLRKVEDVIIHRHHVQ